MVSRHEVTQYAIMTGVSGTGKHHQIKYQDGAIDFPSKIPPPCCAAAYETERVPLSTRRIKTRHDPASRSPTGTLQLLRLPDKAQLHHQRLLVPLDPARLVVPVFAFGGELHVEAPHHAGEDEAHFEVREAGFASVGALRAGRGGAEEVRKSTV